MSYLCVKFYGVHLEAARVADRNHRKNTNDKSYEVNVPMLENQKVEKFSYLFLRSKIRFFLSGRSIVFQFVFP